MTDPAIARKLERVAAGKPLRVLDLFAGCGGISLGFDRAGFQIDAAVELDPLAARSHATNFHRGAKGAHFERHAAARDITQTEPSELVKDLGLRGTASSAFDVVVGGPPCQAYARVGRAKLREVAQHPEAFRVDARGNLYLRYLHYVQETKPLALLMENVPDIMNYGGHNVVGEIADALSDMGYVARYTLVNTARFGVPQMRDRVLLIAFHESLGITPSFPQPSNHVDLPPGYSGTRAVAFKNVDLLNQSFLPEPIGSSNLPYAITAHEAIGDLPPITLHLEGKLKRGARRFDSLIPYDGARPLSAYGKEMRHWPRMESREGVGDHVIRYLPRDTNIFREMANGAEYPAAHQTATRLFNEEVTRLAKAGVLLSASERAILERKMVPPYPVSSFPNRWWKLRPDQPSRTLLAHIGKDTYSHIHYDSAQARTISVREAARLQSFPDGFIFRGTMNPAFRQIGNAVPPKLAFAVATHIRQIFENKIATTSSLRAA